MDRFLEPMLPPRQLLEKRLRDGVALRFLLHDDALASAA